MSRARWILPALVAVAGLGRRDACPRRRRGVRAGCRGRRGRERALPRPVVRPDASRRPGRPALTTEDVTVTENGTPVKNLSVLSSASGEGIGTVLLIDASNSMKGSIDAAMAAARAFAARNPGQPLSVVFFSSEPKVALPLTTDRAQVAAVLAKAPKLSEGTRIYDALAAAVAQVRGSALGAARIVLLSDGDDVGSVTTADSALSQLQAQNIRVFTVGIESPDFVADDLERIAEETGGSYASAGSPSALTDDLRRARLQARKRVPPALQLRRAARPERRRRDRRAGPRAGVVLVREPRGRDRWRPTSRRSATQFLQSWVLIPLVVLLILGTRLLRGPLASGASARTRLSSRGSASSSRFPRRSGRRRGARRSTSSSPRWASRASSAEASAGSTASPRTSTSGRSTVTRRR